MGEIFSRWRAIARALVVSVGVGVGAVAGCGSGEEKDDPALDARRAEAQAVLDPAASRGRAREGGKAGEEGSAAWVISLGPVPQNLKAWQVQDQVSALRLLPGLRDVRVADRGAGEFFVMGEYTGPEDPAAQTDLAAVKRLRDGNRPMFPTALLVPPSGKSLVGTTPEWDLRRVRSDPALEGLTYTLQIGLYAKPEGTPNAEELADIRKTAELAVQKLREEGYQAFYYHGPQRSTVTVGLFAEEDVKSPLGYAAKVEELQAKFPHNLLNGQAQNQITLGPDGKRSAKTLASAIVAIPRN